MRRCLRALLLLLPALPALASGSLLSTSSVLVRPGEDFFVQVRIDRVSSLYGCGFDLKYDPALADVRQQDVSGLLSPVISEGAFLDAAGTTRTYSAAARRDTSPGRLVVGLTRVGPCNGASSTSQRVLLAIGMHSLTTGVLTLALENVVLQDSSGASLPVTMSSTATVKITAAAANQPPVASAAANRIVRPGRSFILDATGSFDPDGDPLSYRWHQQTGPTVDLGDPTRPAMSVVAPPRDGTLGFTVSVSDGTSTSQASLAVTVSSTSNTPPRVVAGFPYPGASGVVVEPVTLFDDESDPASVAAQFSTDGTTFSTATPATAFGKGLATDPAGFTYLFSWDSADDLGPMRASAVWLRFTAADTAVGPPATIGPFAVDTSAFSLQAAILSPISSAALAEQDDVHFLARATAPGGRALTGGALEWSSSLAGSLGQGTEFYRRLPVGPQSLTLHAVSSPRLSQTTSIGISVIAAPASARMRLSLDKGPNLIALPFDPGTTAHPYLMGDLLRDLGAGFAVRTPAATEDSARFVVSVAGLTPSMRPVRGAEGYLVTVVTTRAANLFARPWPAGDYRLDLRPGWQWLALPGAGGTLTADGLARLTSSPVVVETESPAGTGPARFRVLVPGNVSASVLLRPDRSYGVLPARRGAIVMPGGTR